jgi:hypothetical protein
MLSPIYGDLKGSTPTMLTSGTRDLFPIRDHPVHRLVIGVPRFLL